MQTQRRRAERSALVGFALLLGCASRSPIGGSESETSGSESETGETAATGTSTGATTGTVPCSGFATGSLSNLLAVPTTVTTGLGISLSLGEIRGDNLAMQFLCTSNSELLMEGDIPQGGAANSGATFDVSADGQVYAVGFEWVPEGADVRFSVAVMPG